MKKIQLTPRPELDAIAAAYGFDFYVIDDKTYWDESRAYQFTLKQIENDLEDPTQELHYMLMDAVGLVVNDEQLLRRFAIPESAWDAVRNSFRNVEPSLYGRFDLCYNGTGPAKMYEANYDTPTSLFEASVFQWDWVKSVMPDRDQYNSIHENLISGWKYTKDVYKKDTVHFACVTDSIEDTYTVKYLLDTAVQAGFQCKLLDIAQVGIGYTNIGKEPTFTDMQDEAIELLFKLYPYEHLFREDFGKHIGKARTRFIEPPWKAVLSNKALLPLLWKLHPNHPNLIESHYSDEVHGMNLKDFALKAFFSREGANIHLPTGETTSSEEYAGGMVYQKFTPLTKFGDSYPVIGSWVINGRASGIGIREDDSLITKNTSRFVPHFIKD